MEQHNDGCLGLIVGIILLIVFIIIYWAIYNYAKESYFHHSLIEKDKLAMKEKSYFKGIKFLIYGNENFVIDKFSGYKKVDGNIQLINYHHYKVTYYIELYFSGNVCKLSTFENVPLFDAKSKGKFFGIFKDYTKEAKFIKEGNYFNKFEQSNYKSGKCEGIIDDYHRWFAKQTGTEKALDKLKEKIEMAFTLIDDSRKKKSESK